MGMRVVIDQLKVVEIIVIDGIWTAPYVEARQRTRLTTQLLSYLLQMIVIDVGITRTDNDFPGSRSHCCASMSVNIARLAVL